MAPSPFTLEGKRALVTGASRGIGRAIAIAYAECGADVALIARDTDALKEVSAQIQQLSRTALVVPCDLSDPEQIRQAVATTLDQFTELNIVVNNAGELGHAGPFTELLDEDWTTGFRVNFESVVRMCRAVAPHMLDRGSGSIVNMSSVAGLAGVPMLSTYAAAKAATISLSRTLAAEWAARGVRVNALTPGWVATDMTQQFTAHPEVGPGLLRAVPGGRFGTPEDVTGAAVYLASDAAGMVTGECLTLDGAMTAYHGGSTMIDLLSLGRIKV
ncbi:SDR family NAD(P)-dependent oxidoreductase [Actinomycetota bacterium Odt1-20B]